MLCRSRRLLPGNGLRSGGSAVVFTFGLLALCATVFTGICAKDAHALDLRRSAWAGVAAEHGLDPYLLYAVALVESNKNKDKGIAPYPLAMATQGRSYYPKNRNDAERILRELQRSGQNVAVGMMQISIKDHARQVDAIEDLFDPLKNLYVGARVLDEGLRSDHPELAVRLGRYNAWKNDDVARAYGKRVLGVCLRLVTLARSSGARVAQSMCEGGERPVKRKVAWR